MTNPLNRFLSELSDADKRSLSEVFGVDLPTTTSGLLNLEYGYRDGPPSWPGAPTADDAAKQRGRQIKRLRRFAANFPGADKLAAKLESCVPNERCTSGACPERLRAAQRVLVGLQTFVCHQSQEFKTKQLVALSVMSPAWRTPLNHLRSMHLSRIQGELLRTLERTGNFNWLGLGMDVSLNDDTQKGLGIFWQVQWYGIAGVDDRQSFAKGLRESFVSSSETVKRPVRVVACDGSQRALSYTLKTQFVRRVAYWGEGLTRAGQLRQCWRTRKVALRAPQEVELRLWLNVIGIGNRVLMTRSPRPASQP
jgi:hypothetical protein